MRAYSEYSWNMDSRKYWDSVIAEKGFTPIQGKRAYRAARVYYKRAIVIANEAQGPCQYLETVANVVCIRAALAAYKAARKVQLQSSKAARSKYVVR